ncbi:MAG: aminotransferase class V-fold PLP-dependent enzyme [Lachnospiraceae bacterium]|nr:aminotransferase class V-fold PLP-dependent enzyme [Lachnospiraceae bacterium]
MIYLDNAATTVVKPPEVAEAVAAAIQHMGNPSRGAHARALGASRIIYETREKTAAFFGCKRADHVIFTANSTEALNIAIFGTLSRGDHVISTDLEHNSVLRPLYEAEKNRGVSLSFVRADRRGCISYEEMETLFRPDTKAVVCTHASNLTGNMLDLKRIADMAHKRDALLIVDASQTAGVKKIDMSGTGIDILCFTGHKGLMGPQGTGGMCIREGVEIRPFKMGGTGVQSYSKVQPEAYPARLEAGTLNGHGIAGLSAAFDFLNRTGTENIDAKEQRLMNRFLDGIRGTEGIRIYGDFRTERCAIVSLNIRDYDSGDVSDALEQDFGIATRPGAHCAPRMHEALGTREQGAVRFSFSWYNTEEEADAAARAVRTLAAEE